MEGNETWPRMETFREEAGWPRPVLSVPSADTEQTAGLQSHTPDCVGYAMPPPAHPHAPFCCGANQTESKRDWPLVIQHVPLIEIRKSFTAAA